MEDFSEDKVSSFLDAMNNLIKIIILIIIMLTLILILGELTEIQSDTHFMTEELQLIRESLEGN